MALTKVAAGVLDTTAQYTGFKNRIINGDMRIDQRNAGAAVTASASFPYTVDRWQCGGTQSSKFTVQRSVVAPAGFTNSALITSSSAYSIVASDYFVFQQAIEGFNIADLGWGTADAQSITFSFSANSSLTGTFGGAISNSAINRSYPFTYTISAANTWEKKTITIAGDTSGTWLTTNGIGISIRFGLGVGSTNSGTAGSWASAAYFSATGAVSVVGTSGATFYVTGVQLEKGNTATAFDYRDYGRELILSQRYFEIIGGVVVSGTLIYKDYYFKVTKRANPTLSNIVIDGGTGATFSSITPIRIYQETANSTASNFSVWLNSEL